MWHARTSYLDPTDEALVPMTRESFVRLLEKTQRWNTDE